jgi:putative ABC transport system permease protein
MRIPILRGRDVARSDTRTTAAVAVVSRSFAELYWPGESPIGRQFKTVYQDDTYIVVGVVGDVRVRGLEQESEPQMYFASAQTPDGAFMFYAPKDLVVRTSGAPGSLVAAVRAVVTRADPEQPISDVQLMTDVVDRETSARSTQLSMLLAFAGLALVLALVGIHSLLAYVVAARTQEIGVRVALGATPAGVIGLVLRRTLALGSLGVAIGVAGAFAASQTFRAMLAGVSAADGATYALAAVLVAGVALAGSIGPARRAMQVDPLTAMRAE